MNEIIYTNSLPNTNFTNPRFQSLALVEESVEAKYILNNLHYHKFGFSEPKVAL